jgi:DNA-binding beta-propeller fold protein YncE
VVAPFAEYTSIPPTANVTDIPVRCVDIMMVDQQSHKLYVTDNILLGVDVFDVSKPLAKYLKTIPNSFGQRGNGLALAPELHKIFVGLGPYGGAPGGTGPGNSYVEIINTRNDTIQKTLQTGTNTFLVDEMDYDPFHKEVWAANGQDHFMNVIDAVHNTIKAKITLTKTGGLEQPRYNPNDKMVYLNGSDDNVMYQFDPSTNTLKNTFNLPSGSNALNPTGLAINPETNQALLGGNYLALWDFKTHSVVKTLKQWGGGDVTAYDPAADVYLVANFTAKPGPVLEILSSGKDAKFLSFIPTVFAAHTLAFSESTNMVYVFDQNTPNVNPFNQPWPGAYVLGFPIPQALHDKSSEGQNGD